MTAAYGAFSYQINEGGHFLPAVVIDRPAVGTGWGVAVGDADGDRDLDVYGMVSRGLRHNPDDAVFLNNSLEFTRVKVPTAGGAADDVIALDPRGDGRAAFLVLNGRKRLASGPVQLIHVFRGWAWPTTRADGPG